MAGLYRHWLSRPAQVRPPGGETLGQTQQRLCGAVSGICRRHRRQGVLLVPAAVALLRAALEHVELDRLWELVQPAASWSSYDTDGQFS
jgi:broad specificity phosphatase PhoE